MLGVPREGEPGEGAAEDPRGRRQCIHEKENMS
jgi:hypothetical protein